ncbi:MAG: hypothetical protein ACFBRM_09630 [Pikeienuella sp.]
MSGIRLASLALVVALWVCAAVLLEHQRLFGFPDGHRTERELAEAALARLGALASAVLGVLWFW